MAKPFVGGDGLICLLANVAGSNCIGPSAPAELAPLCTPDKFDCPLSDSTVPMAARIVHLLPLTLIFTSGTASRFVASSSKSCLLCPFDQTLQAEWISKWRISQPGRLNGCPTATVP
jgi:hypothetical protein